MIRLARLSIGRPRAALGFWAILAIALAMLGLGVRDSLSPSISVVPGSESSRAPASTQARQSFERISKVMGRWSWWPTTAPGVPPVSRPVPPIAPKGAS